MLCYNNYCGCPLIEFIKTYILKAMISSSAESGFRKLHPHRPFSNKSGLFSEMIKV
uniref:Uncharacterized protein n=1 Tax=Anguilla anguilla TaxID=7936 RepID=A0A0E9U5B2_ANGAN